ncbi:MAG: hypothetical protein ABSC35_02250 [Candidatus Dormibacteria bacterium]|jgi:hypothetical protein
MRRLARKLALFQVGALLLLGIGLASCGYPTAPECGSPNPAHTAAISADPAVACFMTAAAHCKSMELDVLGDGYDNSVDQHFIITPSDHCRIDDYVVYDYNSVQTTALDWQCTSFAQLPDWGLVLTGCTPPVDCYSDLGAPVIDPPAVAPSLPPEATPTPVPSFIATPAPAGSPAINGQPHC